MTSFSVGDLVILKSGSMRMVVETITEDGEIATVWCNDGVIGRDVFAPVLLNRAEERQNAHAGHRPNGHHHGGHQGGHRGDRDDFRGHGGHRGERDDRGGHRGGEFRGGGGGGGRDFDGPPRKQGWDGKPRDKKYFRKDG